MILLVPLATASAGSALITLAQDYEEILPVLFFVGALLVTVSMLHQRDLLRDNQTLAVRVQEGAARLDILHQLSVGLNLSLDIRQIAQLVLDHAVRSTNADAGALWLRPDFDVAGVEQSTTGTSTPWTSAPEDSPSVASSDGTPTIETSPETSGETSREEPKFAAVDGDSWHLISSRGWDDAYRQQALKKWHRALNEGALCNGGPTGDAHAGDGFAANAFATRTKAAQTDNAIFRLLNKNKAKMEGKDFTPCSEAAHQVGVEGAVDCPVLGAALEVGAAMATAEIKWQNETIGLVSVARWRDRLNRDDSMLLGDIALMAAPSLENSLLYQTAATRADVDGLTELLNHRAVQERMTQEVARAQRAHRDGAPVVLSVVLMDLADFKLFNDTYGHAVGDDVLRAVSDRLRENFRATDTVARYGGDEFLALLPGTGAAQAQIICSRLLSALSARPFVAPDGSRIEIRLTCGIAEWSLEHSSAADLFQTADANLYEAKHQGRGLAREAGEDTQQPLLPADASDLSILSDDALNAHALRALQRDLADVLGQVVPTPQLWESFGVLSTLISAIDNRDHYTRRQGERVMTFGLLLAHELRWPREMLEAVQICGLIHDVGKVAVPDVILRKPGLLNPEELVLMQQHAAFGAMIVHDVPQRERVLEGVRAHHEAFDGSGYPLGLSGEQIPPMGRLLAIPDSFAAMTTDRPYRKSLSPFFALQEIERGRGTRFDPVMVDAFLSVMRKLGASPPNAAVAQNTSAVQEAEAIPATR